VRLAKVQETLQAELICGAEMLDREVEIVCSADLMSDVLAYANDKTVLITGLINRQVIRTAEMSDLIGIVFVRGKRPGAEIIAMAELKGIPLLVSQYPMYEACGLLYVNGLRGCTGSGDASGA